jgi:hypothetical protein
VSSYFSIFSDSGIMSFNQVPTKTKRFLTKIWELRQECGLKDNNFNNDSKEISINDNYLMQIAPNTIDKNRILCFNMNPGGRWVIKYLV